MVSEPLLFAFALFDTGAVLFLLVYFVITLSDLECDYLNAQQCCSKLNTVIPVLPNCHRAQCLQQPHINLLDVNYRGIPVLLNLDAKTIA